MASILKVNEIQHTGGTSALTVDSSGRILQPAKPSFFAYRTYGDQSDIDYTSGTVVDFDATQHNIGGHYSTSTNIFTVPVDGVYHFSWQVRMANVTVANYIYAALRKNNNANWGSFFVYGNLEDPQGGSYQSPHTSATLQLSANDEIDIAIVVNGDASSRIQSNLTFFSGFLVG